MTEYKIDGPQDPFLLKFLKILNLSEEEFLKTTIQKEISYIRERIKRNEIVELLEEYLLPKIKAIFNE